MNKPYAMNKPLLIGILSGLGISLVLFASLLGYSKLSDAKESAGYQACVNDIVNNVNTTGGVKIPVTDADGQSGFYLLAPVPQADESTPEEEPTDE